MAHNAHWIYMTAKDMDEAVLIGNKLVESELAACINILGNINSIFMWEGNVQHETEIAFIAKARADKVPKLVEMVKTLHSYDVPCIISLPISDGNPEFIKWITD